MKILKKNDKAEEKETIFFLVPLCSIRYISHVITFQFPFWLNALLKVDAANIQKGYFECASYDCPNMSHCN